MNQHSNKSKCTQTCCVASFDCRRCLFQRIQSRRKSMRLLGMIGNPRKSDNYCIRHCSISELIYLFCRSAVWDSHSDYPQSTDHGIGSFFSVRECKSNSQILLSEFFLLKFQLKLIFSQHPSMLLIPSHINSHSKKDTSFQTVSVFCCWLKILFMRAWWWIRYFSVMNRTRTIQ